MNSLQRISERVNRLGSPDNPETPRPLLTLEEFFEGNEVIGSIGCNLPGAPTPQQMYAVLKVISKRSDVKDVRVQITAFDDPDWPFSDTVHIMTSASTDEVGSWFDEDLAPDDVWEGFQQGQVYEPYVVPMGSKVITCWWD
jgi:hypothetical protein